VIDGDTLWAVIDCGFDTLIREKLRFRGIDAPELDTPVGKKAKQFVTRTLNACSCVVIQTHKTDKYARYLSDIFYLPGCKQYERIASQGHFLNQELLDKGLAQAWKP
jgi:endonuclease YncB( thermonuclease family)